MQVNKRSTQCVGFMLSAVAIALSLSSCSKDIGAGVEVSTVAASNAVQASLEDLRAYKASDHPIMAAYFRTWRDKATDPSVNKTSMKELPDSLDIAFVFPDYTPADNAFWDSLKTSYVPHLRERGTKVVMTADVSTLLDTSFPNTPQGYTALAAKIIAEKVTAYDLDGIDFDVERSLNTTELQRATGVLRALSQH